MLGGDLQMQILPNMPKPINNNDLLRYFCLCLYQLIKA